MRVDLRQVVAGILTLAMFVMLGHMIKRDHFDFQPEKLPAGARDVPKLAAQGLATLPTDSDDPFKEDGQELKPCWTTRPFDDVQQSDGHVTFSLTDGPEYHVSQIADAVVVAKYLGAILVLPDIRGSKLGDEWSFGDIYDGEKFIQSLDGVVRVVKDLPYGISPRKIPAVRVPNGVTEEYISAHVEKVYRKSGNVRIATYFSSFNMKKTSQTRSVDSVACLAMFGSLELLPEIKEVVDTMVERLRTLSRKSNGQFIAVDLRIDFLEKSGCLGGQAAGTKGCYGAEEIAFFLRKINFNKDATIYLTQSRWDGNLDALKDLFPKTYTKEGIIPADKKAKYLGSDGTEFEKVIDFYICSQSDVFVPAIYGLFYSNVAGKRIALGKNKIFLPADISGSSALASDFISPYISKKDHLAYSCFC